MQETYWTLYNENLVFRRNFKAQWWAIHREYYAVTSELRDDIIKRFSNSDGASNLAALELREKEEDFNQSDPVLL